MSMYGARVLCVLKVIQVSHVLAGVYPVLYGICSNSPNKIL